MTAPHAVLKKFPPLDRVAGISAALAPRTCSLEEAFIALTGVQS